jgi:polysaccharide deacetylase family protein (PEP-CTERM system associated)
MNKVNLSFDIEDFYMSSTFDDIILRDDWDTLPDNIIYGLDKILNYLYENNIKATFFFLGYVAERNPYLVEKVFNFGHEIASHGYNHLLVNNMSDIEFYNDLNRSKKILESIIGTEIIGYRAPTFSLDLFQFSKLKILEDLGFKYDSSLFPLSSKRNGNEYFGNDIFKLTNNLFELPLSVSKISKFKFPIGGGYFRLYPYFISKYLIERTISKNTTHIYLHPWEFDNCHAFKPTGFINSFRHTFGIGDNLIRKLELLKNDFTFNGTLRELISVYE